jgi:hypothetical protein
MKKKSNKLARLERNRFSVFYSLDYCMNCGSNYQLTKHEVFEGRNRLNSMEDGFVLPLCWNCHRKLQEDATFNDYWKKKAQTYFEENIGTREDFIKRYRRNYL